MSQLHLSDEIMMAFADGELEEPVAAAVAKAMAENSCIAKRVVEFQQSRRLTRSAFSASLVPDVPPALQAAVLAKVRTYEARSVRESISVPRPERSAQSWQGKSFVPVALAASLAVLAVALGYFAGRQTNGEDGSLIAQLDSPLIQHELSHAESGWEVQLPMGQMRVISTYRLANGTLCREFKLQTGSDAAHAIACRTDEWNLTFALAGAPSNADYMPSSGGDPVAAYLQSVGAGEPLVDEDEAKALAESIP